LLDKDAYGDLNIIVLPGDGIGPEVIRAAVAVLDAVGERFGHNFQTQEHLIGGCAIDNNGTALPENTLAACRTADAVLLGAVGGPIWDDPNAKVRPEDGLLGLRKELGLFANLRPVRATAVSMQISPIRPQRLQGVDMMVVRELTGGIYFGQPRGRMVIGDEIQAVDSMVYTESEVSRIAYLAFDLASKRRNKVTSVDKANVLESSRLWREVVNEVAAHYPHVTLEHNLVDAAAIYLISRPQTFDVILTSNMFGDILTDEASVLAGSMGLLPSASLGESRNKQGYPLGLYEPIHGSAPDIAGKNIANPVGAILSAALLLRHSLGLEAEAEIVEDAVEKALSTGNVTIDLAAPGQRTLTTGEVTQFVVKNISDGEE
jgi:3-isopropylmalate dehydrogenase